MQPALTRPTRSQGARNEPCLGMGRTNSATCCASDDGKATISGTFVGRERGAVSRLDRRGRGELAAHLCATRFVRLEATVLQPPRRHVVRSAVLSQRIALDALTFSVARQSGLSSAGLSP